MMLSNIGWLSSLASASPSTLLNNLVAYWNFDQASGDSEPDLAGGVGTLTPVFIDESPTSAAGPNATLARQFGGSLFDGTSQSALVASTTAPALPLTMNFWLRNPAFMEASGGSLPFCFNEVSTWGPSFSLYFFEGTTYCNVHDDLGGFVGFWNPSSSYCDDTWHMWTIILAAGSAPTIYVDAILAADFVLTDWSPTPTLDPDATALPPIDSVSFGCSIFGGNLNNGDMSVGYVSKGGMWNRELIPAEIDQLYNAGSGLLYSNL